MQSSNFEMMIMANCELTIAATALELLCHEKSRVARRYSATNLQCTLVVPVLRCNDYWERSLLRRETAFPQNQIPKLSLKKQFS